MLYLISEDEYYYTDKAHKAIKETYGVSQIIKFPTEKVLRESMMKPSGETCFLAPYPPSKLGEIFADNSFLEVVRLKNKYGFLTTGQKRLGLDERTVLSEKLGVNIYEPKLTFKDYGGAEILTEALLLMEEKEKYGIQSKGFMVAGIPGTGKSYFAKCAAGQTGRKLVELNLSLFLEKEDGLQAVSDFFEFFKSNRGRYILWIDEIEKMLVGTKAEQMLGLLLNRINDLNDSKSESSIIFVATANNISGLAKKNPEFFRNGRFDVLVFILNPTHENTKSIFKIHIDAQKRLFKNQTLPKAFKKVQEEEAASDNTRIKDIHDEISRVGREALLELKDLSEEGEILKKILETPSLRGCYESIAEKYKFSFDVKAFTQEATKRYGESSVMPERYVHTPAEIEYIVQDYFSSYLFMQKNEKSENIKLRELVDKYQPLQLTMKDGIQSMLGTADKFIKI